ncbi:MAG: DUF5633 domain-containing protein [Finegoldia magna]|uniref:DUF5633 domain-containing protein n=1 Tax=Finegoldia magna TaxID=1260 RepID=UPI000B9166E4|nr:DUF5633 domain-containing protein [Finegoldia magna]OXZ30129.1 hypothetical protein B9N57_06655 [Finegoldia magna]
MKLNKKLLAATLAATLLVPSFSFAEKADKDHKQPATPATTGTETNKEKETKVDEKSFDFDKGFKTQEEAIKQAEVLVKNSKVNKGYNITKGGDGKYYIQLTPQPAKTEGLKRKEIKKPVKTAKKKLPKAGSAAEVATIATAAMATLGGAFISLKKRK